MTTTRPIVSDINPRSVRLSLAGRVLQSSYHLSKLSDHVVPSYCPCIPMYRFHTMYCC